MSKTKKQIILFMIIVLIGVGYTINEYIITPQKLIIQQNAIQRQADKQKLMLLKNKSSELDKLKAEVAKLKQVADLVGEVTVADIDTPQLIFDFYSSCKNYGVKGEDLIFQLDDSDAKTGIPTSGPTSNSSNGITNESTNSNETTVNNVPTTNTVTTNKTGDINKSEETTDLLKLTIELKVSGDKNKVEKYIRNLDTLTSRKINVKSIKLEATVAMGGNNLTNSNGTISTPIAPNTFIPSDPITDEVTAYIIFNQYIYNDGKDIIRPSDYSFYDENIGFSNFSDMFK